MKPKFILKASAGVFCCSVLGWSGSAQDILTPPPPEYFGISSALRTTGTNQPGEVPPLAPPAPEEPPFELGPARFRPHLLYRFLYGDGIAAQPGQQHKTVIHELYPGMFLQLGNHWNLDYTPVLRFYLNKQFRDTTDHNVSLNGASVVEDWAFGFSQNYVSSSQPLVATGSQTDTETFSTGLNAVYRMSSAASLELGASQNFLFVGQSAPGESLTDTRSWSTMDWLNYQFSPKIAAALGAGFGYDSFRGGSDMTSEQVQGRIVWNPGAKLNVALSGGAEVRQVVDSDAPDLVTPIFGASLRYQIFEATTFGLGASRVVSPSLFLDQVTETTSVSATLHQRLLKKLFLDLSGGYTQSTYRFTVFGFNLTREDKGNFFNARLSATLLKRGTGAIFYQIGENSSTATVFAFSTSQVGFEMGYRF